MIGKKLIDKLPAPPSIKLIIGSAVVALLISPGMVVISQLLGFTLDPAIPAATGAIGAAVHAVRSRS